MTNITNITIYNKMFKKLIVLDLTIPSFGSRNNNNNNNENFINIFRYTYNCKSHFCR